MKFTADAFGAKTMETITFGMYDGNLNCIREYVQNGIDAKDKNITTKNISIYFENGDNDLIIEDDGPGMDKSELKEALKVGISKKTDADIGWRGIGIWSGVPVSKRLVIITKKQSGEKLRVAIDNLELKKQMRTNRPAFEVLSEVTSEMEVLPIRENEKDAHYTIIRLESILITQRLLFNETEIKEYLIKNIPLPFDENKFSFAKKVNSELKNHNISIPNITLKFEGKNLYRYPNRADIFLDHIIFKEFTIDNEKLAFGWFLSKNSNKEHLQQPNRGMFFKMKGFTIGNENTVRGLYPKTYHPWQYGEIHILSKKIKENAGRNSFEITDDPIVLKFLDKIKDYVGDLENANHYQSEKAILNAQVNKIKNAIKNENIELAKNEIQIIKNRKSKKKSFPEEPSLKKFQEYLDRLSEQNYETIINLEQSIQSTVPKPIIKVVEIDTLKERIERLPAFCQPIFLQLYSKGTISPELNVTAPIIELLKEKTGLTENDLSKLTQKAYGWKTIEKSDARPLLTISNGMNEWRDRCLGVMIYSLHELFVNPTKHEKGKPSFFWFESLNKTEEQEILKNMVSSIHLVIQLIEKSTFRQPP
jgi:hypothetical protein